MEHPNVSPPDEISADSRIHQVLALAYTCEYEAGHTHHVTRLALRLFDQLQALHHYASQERFYLHAAALLHDIGWVEGGRGHHKNSLNIILRTSILPFSHTERLIVGGIARYHRKALPHLKHDHFAALDEPDRRVVCLLAGMLRLADALDYSHQSAVEDLRCTLEDNDLIITCFTDRAVDEEPEAAKRECKLLARELQKKLRFVWSMDG